MTTVQQLCNVNEFESQPSPINTKGHAFGRQVLFENEGTHMMVMVSNEMLTFHWFIF